MSQPRGGKAAAAVVRLEVVVFRVGDRRLAVPRDQVKGIRPSPRVRSLLAGTGPAEGLPLVSLSEVLGLDRDTSTDRRVLEVEHWGSRLGLEVTAIEGIRTVRPRELHPLPRLLSRNCGSANVLGLLIPEAREEQPGRKTTESTDHEAVALESPAVALDLSALLVEQGVEVAEDDSTG